MLGHDVPYRIAQNFDGYRLFKYLTENSLTDGHCLSPYTCKGCIVFKQYDGVHSISYMHRETAGD